MRFTEGIGKLTRNMPGDHRRKTVRLATWNVGGSSHNSKSGGNHFSGDYDGQTVDERRVYRHHLGFRAVDDGYPTQVERLNRSYPGIMVLSVIDSPASMGKPPVPWKQGG
ncbi:hypothetical protein GW17_00062095 [Ensete ventricosum]|nr:hypothetical protein GW17_00062095 [Ensete ventricosum]